MTTTTPGPVVIGLGCSSRAEAAEIIALVQSCLVRAGVAPSQVVAVATHARRRLSPALLQTASRFGLTLRYLDDDQLAPGVPGTSEAVAAAAGPLLLPMRKSAFATCAIALAGEGFEAERFGQPVSPRATRASSTLATSLAGS
ncbi:MAG TPA: cobalamin biosynthesis protein [Devosia sp.]|jgi:cobalt-precorrin 5A hydrolase/precorrin-3B C17-methyltransferase|uniref:cobalamin biosynthesis protein n=1 Tax=Devosia sp. TaxID=1871048 RepID=UPI002F956B08